MRLFGLEITKSRGMDSKGVQAAVPVWSAGESHAVPSNYESMVKAYRSWVYVCANKNALSVAQQNLRLYVAKPDKSSKLLQRTQAISRKRMAYLKTVPTVNRLKLFKGASEVMEVLDHPFLDLLQKVNCYMNQFDLWELSTVFQELIGNAYWYIVFDRILGVPSELWVLPAHNVEVVPSKENFIKGYIYTNGATRIPFDVDEIIHFKYANPHDMYYGMSPLAAVTDAYNTNQNILQFTNSLFTNMARPEGVLSTDQKLLQPDFDRLKEQWNSSYGGASKAKKTAVLTKGLKYTPITMTPQELDYTEGRKVVKEEICNAYGQSLGMYDKSATRSNSEQANIAFLRDTVQPRLRRIEEKLNEQMMPLYDENLFVAFDSPVPEDRTFRLKERESNIRSGYSSINQERQKDNQEDVEWGNIPILPSSMIPLGSQVVEPKPTPSPGNEEEKTGKFIVRQIIHALKRRERDEAGNYKDD